MPRERMVTTPYGLTERSATRYANKYRTVDNVRYKRSYKNDESGHEVRNNNDQAKMHYANDHNNQRNNIDRAETNYNNDPDDNNNEQSLDDYVLNQNPIEIKEKSDGPSQFDEDSSKFITSSSAYPDSPYAPFDPLNEDINNYEYVAKEFVSSQPDGLSDNPMDPNWGGVMYTQNVIKSGKYDENNIKKPMLFQPKGAFIDSVPSGFEKPKDIY